MKLLWLSLLALAAADARAQEGPGDAEGEEDAVIEVIGDAPDAEQRYAGSADRVDEAALREAAPMSAAEVLKTVPGVHIVDEEGIGLRANIGLRGLDPNRSRQVLVLEDGVPIALAPYGEPELYYSTPVERISAMEVVKGSGAILYGPQTIGGVVNFLTADPPNEFRSAIKAQGGSYGYLSAFGSVGDREGDTSWRVDLVHKRYAGPRDLNLVANDANAVLVVAPSSASYLRLKLDLYEERSQSTYLGLTTPQFEEDPTANFAIYDLFHIRRYALAATWIYKFAGGARLVSTLYGHDIQRDWMRQDYDRLDQGLDYEREIPGTSGQAALDDGGSVYFRDSTANRDRGFTVGGVEERLSLPWYAGTAFYGDVDVGSRLHHEVAREQLLAGERHDSPSGDLEDDERRAGLALAAWAQGNLHFGQKLRLTPGLRVEQLWNRRHLYRSLVEGEDGETAPADVDIEGQDAVGAIIPGAGLSFTPSPTWNLYGGLHRGFAPPRTKDAIDPDGVSLELEAETSWNYELGLRFSPRPELALELTGFLLDFQNQVVPPSEAGGAVSGGGGSGAEALVNGVATLHRGVELSGQVDPALLAGAPFSLALSGNATVVDARYTGGSYDGHVLPYAPALTASGGARLGLGMGLAASVSGDFTSGQYTDKENTLDPSTDGLRGWIDPIFALNARVSYWRGGRHRMEVWLAGKNLLNDVVIVSRLPAGIQPGGFRQLLAGLELVY